MLTGRLSSQNGKPKTRKSSSLNCFNCLCTKFRRAKAEDEIEVHPELFDEQKMSNPFKSKSRNEDSASASSNSLSASQLVIKPIKSLSSNATGSGRNKVELQPGHSPLKIRIVDIQKVQWKILTGRLSSQV